MPSSSVVATATFGVFHIRPLAPWRHGCLMCGGPAIITISTSHINKRVLTVAKCSSFASVNAHEVSTILVVWCPVPWRRLSHLRGDVFRDSSSYPFHSLASARRNLQTSLRPALSGSRPDPTHRTQVFQSVVMFHKARARRRRRTPIF